MKLLSLQIKGFKCYKDSGIIPFHNLTIFIGENDAGKSTVLDALELLIENKNRVENDLNRDSDFMELTGVFEVNHPTEEIESFVLDNKINIKKTFTRETLAVTRIEILKKCFSNDVLNNYTNLKADDLKNLVSELKLTGSYSTKDERVTAIKNYIEDNKKDLETQEKWTEIKWVDISKYLPLFQRFSSSDYGNPENLIKKTLEIVYQSHFYEEDESGESRLKSDYSELNEVIKKDLDKKLEIELLEFIKRYRPEVNEISGNYEINFSRGFSFSGLKISESGQTINSIGQLGEGSRKKLFLSILEWDKHISLKDSHQKTIIRGYDEPDANLHYEAQRKMFYQIKDLAESESNIQSVICTHSLTMIDRAPAKSINHVIKDPENFTSKIEFLDNEQQDDGIREFLGQISEISGIKNSSIFYEKCFLLVEGPSEQNALPILYKTYFNRSLSEDGVILINLETNGQWSNALKFLRANKQRCTILLLDSDTQDSKRQVTKEKLRDIGFDETFLEEKCFFIGKKEFEDIYPNHRLVEICNSKYQRSDDNQWSEKDFEVLREKVKFSEELKKELNIQCKRIIGKPEIASSIANIMTKEEIEEDSVLKGLFETIKEIVT